MQEVDGIPQNNAVSAYLIAYLPRHYLYHELLTYQDLNSSH